ncbi:hypothetical protein HRbin08_00692 [bacterium HR08]|nr:hypothetical protein HRbin08_00692 [bacterium HR08]
MGFDVKDYLDLVRLLQEHPEWRAELRRLILTDELLALPELVRELADAQRRTEERLLILTERIDALAEAQRRAEERMGRLEAVVEELAEAQRRTEERVGHHEELLQALLESHKRLVEIVGDLKGRMLELTYRDRAAAYFGPLLRRMKVVDPYELEEVLRAHLSEKEFRDILWLDLLVCGQPRVRPEIAELWLAVEISSVVDRGDVERAERRAMTLRRAGYRAIPVVAGERLTQGAEDESRERRVVAVRDGHILFWEEALSAWVEGT